MFYRFVVYLEVIHCHLFINSLFLKNSQQTRNIETKLQRCQPIKSPILRNIMMKSLSTGMWFFPMISPNWYRRIILWQRQSGEILVYSNRLGGYTTWFTLQSLIFSCSEDHCHRATQLLEPWQQRWNRESAIEAEICDCLPQALTAVFHTDPRLVV